MQLLRMTKTSKCADPRDKIYRLLGLADDIDPLTFNIDYTEIETATPSHTSLWNYYIIDSAPAMRLHGYTVMRQLPAPTLTSCKPLLTDFEDFQKSLNGVDIGILGLSAGTPTGHGRTLETQNLIRLSS